MATTILTAAVRAVDALNAHVGAAAAWLAAVMALTQFAVVIMRYVFAVGSIPAQESIWYMHGTLFMLGAGWTLLHDGHVRVDIIYRSASPRYRAKVDLAGALFFLMPICIYILLTSWPYVVNSWKIREGSIEISGIQGIYLLKTVIPVAAALLLLQGIAMAVRAARRLAAPAAAEAAGE